jgi:hypothetical protein
MRRGASIFLAASFLTFAIVTTPAPPAHSADESGTFVVISDIHFDPFSTPELASAMAIWATPDDYRLLLDERGTALSAAKLGPAISPVFGQNAAFQVFTYDKVSGTPQDFSTWYLSNPGLPVRDRPDARGLRRLVLRRAAGAADQGSAGLWPAS